MQRILLLFIVLIKSQTIYIVQLNDKDFKTTTNTCRCEAFLAPCFYFHIRRMYIVQ